MAMTIEQPETMETAGGKYVDKPGIYHAIITNVDENPAKQDGTPLNGARFTASILAGTNPDQVGKEIDVMMWNPSPHDEPKKQDAARRVQTAFCLATCLIGEYKAGAKAVVELSDAMGGQVVLKLRNQQEKVSVNGKDEWKDVEGKVQLSWSDIYHVDDPWVEKNNVPLDQAAINNIAASLRKEKVASANGQSAPSLVDKVANKPVATASSVDVGDV